MIIETKINLKNKTKEELIDLINESLEIINKQNTDKQKLVEILNKYEHVEANEDSAMKLYIELKQILKGENDEC